MNNGIYMENESKIILKEVENFYKEVFKRNLQNEQWFLNWLDNLNLVATQW